MIVTVIFQSTPSAWRETAPSASNKNLTGKFQSTPSAWRETIRLNQDDFTTCISIHSLRMEGDKAALIYFVYSTGISIHSLRMEGDAYSTMLFSTIKSFQSTPSAWRETHTAEQYDGQENAFQSTPSAWRETTQNMLRGVC